MIAVWCMMYFGCNACWVEWLSQISTDTNTFIISHCLMFARAICVDCGLPNEWGRRVHTHTHEIQRNATNEVFSTLFSFCFFRLVRRSNQCAPTGGNCGWPISAKYYIYMKRFVVGFSSLVNYAMRCSNCTKLQRTRAKPQMYIISNVWFAVCVHYDSSYKIYFHLPKSF